MSLKDCDFIRIFLPQCLSECDRQQPATDFLKSQSENQLKVENQTREEINY
ncbi:hypothetical protein [Microcoleus sp. F10B5]|uniref:hypothetical protein n=1 Tax=Microcoleus sp. F10B5 TaxID=3055341 RepID=UPI002FD30C81